MDLLEFLENNMNRLLFSLYRENKYVVQAAVDFQKKARYQRLGDGMVLTAILSLLLCFFLWLFHAFDVLVYQTILCFCIGYLVLGFGIILTATWRFSGINHYQRFMDDVSTLELHLQLHLKVEADEQRLRQVADEFLIAEAYYIVEANSLEQKNHMTKTRFEPSYEICRKFRLTKEGWSWYFAKADEYIKNGKRPAAVEDEAQLVIN